MFTTTKLAELIGRPALLNCNGLSVQVEILDSRQCWNRTDCLVRPVAGSGEKWVACDRLSEPCADDLFATERNVDRVLGLKPRAIAE